jgi:hypothetical protein
MSDRANRSFEKITQADLHRLSSLALADFEDFFRRYHQWRAYRERLMLICLCQGAARHYVTPSFGVATDRAGGVNDFDVWGFFRHDPNDRPFPPRRHGLQDFGPSKFGRSVDDKPRFIGRRVDVWGRSIEKLPSENPIQAVQRYLRTHHSDSARLVAERPVVVLWPAERLGEIIWRRG